MEFYTDLSNVSPKSALVATRQLKTEEAIANISMALPPVSFVDFRNDSLLIKNGELNAYGAYYNQYYGNSWLLHHPGDSYIQLSADVAKLENRSYSLDLVHLSSLVNGESLAQITIEVNGHVVVAGHNPNDGNFVRESFDITPYIVDGKNEVRISFDSTSQSNYWIQSLAIQAR